MIAKGMKADLAVFNDELEVSLTMVDGEIATGGRNSIALIRKENDARQGEKEELMKPGVVCLSLSCLILQRFWRLSGKLGRRLNYARWQGRITGP